MDNSAVRKSALAGPSEPSQKTPQPWPQPRLPLAPSSSAPRGGGGHKRGAVATITEWCPGARSGSSEPCCANRDRIRKSREKRAGELLLELKIVDLTHPPSLLMYDAMSDCCSCWVLASSTSRRSWSIRPARPAQAAQTCSACGTRRRLRALAVVDGVFDLVEARDAAADVLRELVELLHHLLARRLDMRQHLVGALLRVALSCELLHAVLDRELVAVLRGLVERLRCLRAGRGGAFALGRLGRRALVQLVLGLLRAAAA